MYSEDQLLPLSAVGQYVHCPRRFALIHVEGLWEDNCFTAEGTILHEKADSGIKESRGSVRIVRSMRLRSFELGVVGIADVVEFRRVAGDEMGVSLPKVPGKWMPFPVEYKRGEARNIEGYKAQLCLQALCLEEMLNVSISSGALYLGKKHGRIVVEFSTELRSAVIDACHAMQRLVLAGKTPLPCFGKWCASCSLVEPCRPELTAPGRSAKSWLESEIKGALA